MGLLGSIFFGGGGKTKADWDRKIMSLNNDLASYQRALEEAKDRERRAKQNRQNVSFSHDSTYWKGQIANCKAEIANAKVQRRNAPN